MDKPEYYINIVQPTEFRKTLLEASKEIIMSLKDFHALHSIRRSKLETIEVLKDQIKELTFLMEKLDEKLPNRKIDYETTLHTAKEEVVEPEEPKPEPKVEAKPKTDVEVDKLQDALASIEKKLSKL